MGASAGRYGVAIGTGAAGGAGVGAAFGPVGAGIGAGVGALGGALSTLLSASHEARQKKVALDEYKRQHERALAWYQEQALREKQAEWDQRWAAMTGIAGTPAYMGLSYKPYDPQKTAADFNAQGAEYNPAKFGRAFDASLPQPDYGGLAQSLGSLGSTVGGLSRQAEAADKLGLAQINADKNPWTSYADDANDPLQKLLEEARSKAWDRTGGW